MEEEVRDIFSIVATTALTVINYVHFIQVIFKWAAGHAHPTMDYLSGSANHVIVYGALSLSLFNALLKSFRLPINLKSMVKLFHFLV